MRDYQFTVSASGQVHKPVGGNFIKVKSTTAEIRVIAEDENGQAIADIGMNDGTWITLPDRFETVRVTNETGSSINATLTIGAGIVDDSELTGTITASKGTGLDNASHTVGVAAAVLLAADTARRAVTILNEDAANDIYIGKTGVTVANGLKVVAGQSLTLEHSASAAIYAIGSAAGITVKTLEELD